MSWLVDNANSLYILLGAIAAGFVVGWKLNARVKFLGYAAGILVLMGVIWALTLFVVSDSKQLEKNVHAMADAVVSATVVGDGPAAMHLATAAKRSDTSPAAAASR